MLSISIVILRWMIELNWEKGMVDPTHKYTTFHLWSEMTDVALSGRHRCTDFWYFVSHSILPQYLQYYFDRPHICPKTEHGSYQDFAPLKFHTTNRPIRQNDPPNSVTLPPLPIHSRHAKTPYSHLRRPARTSTTKSTPSRTHLHSISTIHLILITFSQIQIKR